MWRAPILIALALGGLALAGCGSGASRRVGATPATGTASATGRPANGFLVRLNMLCAQGNQAVRGASSVRAAAKTFQHYLNLVEALVPPASQRATFAQFTGLLARRLTYLRVGQLTAAKLLRPDISRLASKLGASACA